MTKVPTRDVKETAAQIRELENAGCEIVRVAVKSEEDANAISAIKQETTIPLVADIHFDHRLAVTAAAKGADKIRINPGNITEPSDIDSIIDAVSDRNIPVRLGINSGSLMDVTTGRAASVDMMVGSLTEYIEHFQKRNFHDIVLSLKSSDVPRTVEAYRKMSERCDYPFHLGVTAAGLPADGMVRSSVGIGSLLMDGIGDTIRVSLTGDPVEEVYTAKRILDSVGVRHFGSRIIACPTCGRCQVDLVSIVKKLEAELKRDTKYEIRDTDKQLLIAVMGCEVNGPGEAMEADIGIAFGKGKGVIFRRGEIVKTIKADSAVKELLEMIRKEV